MAQTTEVHSEDYNNNKLAYLDLAARQSEDVVSDKSEWKLKKGKDWSATSIFRSVVKSVEVLMIVCHFPYNEIKSIL